MVKYICIFCSICLFIIGCNFKKVTNVELTNRNNYPVTITIRTNNVEKSFPTIPPGETIRDIYEWTNLEDREGHWDIFVASSAGRDSFAHGYFTHAELTNYLEAISEGTELKIKLSN